MTALKSLAGLTCALALAGCADDRQFQAVKKDTAELKEQVILLQARMGAVEEACLQLNERMNGAQQSRRESQPPAAEPVQKPAKASIDSRALHPELNARPTRKSFGSHLNGMTVGEVLTLLGKPATVKEEGGAQSWIYSEVILNRESGGVEQSAALVVFENGAVSRAVLTDGVEYSSEPKATAPASTATPAAGQ